MVIRAIAFDGNGVLYFRGEDFVDAVAEHFVRQWAPGLEPDAVRVSFRKAMNASFDGTYGKRDAIARFLKEWGVDDPAALQDVEAKELEYSRRISLFPTERETLLELAAHGFPMGMITNTFQSAGEKTRWFEELGLGCAVRTVVSSIDVGIAKPDPGIYLEFARRVGFKPAEIAFVGHEEYEIAGARRAGMITISFNCPAELVADFHLPVFSDLLGIMELHGQPERMHEKAGRMKYDIVSIGHITNDVRDMMGERTPFVGGAAWFSSFAAARSGAKVFVITKMAGKDRGSTAVFSREGIEARFLPSKKTTSMENIFLSPDPDDRRLKLVSVADFFTLEDIAAAPDAEVYHIAALSRDETPVEAIRILAARGKVAFDLQAALRYYSGESVVYDDWEAKKTWLPFIHYVKADSHETKIVTGLDSREEAAKLLHAWGGKEIVITRQDEVLVFDGMNFYRAPFDPRRLDGRAGRGDTCFLAYIARRKTFDIDASVHWAAALTSIKMENYGPFTGTVAEVEARMKGQTY